MLAATPLRLEAGALGVDPLLLGTKPAPHEWSANDVLAHLRACADV